VICPADILSCGSEERLCYGNNNLDGGYKSELQLWNSACDDKITFSPTTPVLSSLTATYDEQYCTSAASACQDGEAGLQACSISYLGKDVQKYSSCYCAPSLLSAEYTCGFLGNTSCEQIPATLTNMVQYKYCDNFLEVLRGSGSVSLLHIP
jgi:hypothetical protein